MSVTELCCVKNGHENDFHGVGNWFYESTKHTREGTRDGGGGLKIPLKTFWYKYYFKTRVTPNILFYVPKFKMFIFSLADKSVAREENFESLFLLLHLPKYIRHNIFLRKP